MPIVYAGVPAPAAWKKDSNVTLATRANDPVLMRIDELVQAYSLTPDAGAQLYIACDLFFTLDYWLKIYKTTPKMEKGREPAVMALYKAVVDQLGRAFGKYFGAANDMITPNNLPTALELFFGRTLSGHGVELDLRSDCAIYLSRAEVAKYRLSFKKGRAYQFPWWKDKAKSSAVELAESSHAYNGAVFNGAGRHNWGGFAMSMSREIYMAKHHCTTGRGAQGNFYHSSYLAGEPVMCAGTMLIEKGVIKAISTDSGHYQPDNRHVVNLLQALVMHRVDITNIDVQDYSGAVQAKGAVFLQSNGNWASMWKRQQLNMQHLDARRLKEREFGDAIKRIWDQGVQNALYTDDMPGRLYFVSHVLPKLYNVQGLNFLYALDALAKATSRATDPSKDWNAWCIDKWRTHLKAEGVANKATNVPGFAAWLKRTEPGVATWTQQQLADWANQVFKDTGHRFDA